MRVESGKGDTVDLLVCMFVVEDVCMLCQQILHSVACLLWDIVNTRVFIYIQVASLKSVYS